MSIIFTRALNALSTGDDTSDAPLVNLGLAVLLGTAVGNPLLDVFMRGTSDIWLSIWGRVPISRVARMRRETKRLEIEYDAILVRTLEALEGAEKTDALKQRVLKYETQVRADLERDDRERMSRLVQEVVRGEASEADIERERDRVARVYAAMDEARSPVVELDTSAAVEEAWDLVVEIAELGASASRRAGARVEAMVAKRIDRSDALLKASQEQWSK